MSDRYKSNIFPYSNYRLTMFSRLLSKDFLLNDDEIIKQRRKGKNGKKRREKGEENLKYILIFTPDLTSNMNNLKLV